MLLFFLTTYLTNSFINLITFKTDALFFFDKFTIVSINSIQSNQIQIFSINNRLIFELILNH